MLAKASVRVEQMEKLKIAKDLIKPLEIVYEDDEANVSILSHEAHGESQQKYPKNAVDSPFVGLRIRSGKLLEKELNEPRKF